MKNVNEVTVTLSPKEAEEFRTYMAYKDHFDVMLRAGVLDMRRGSVEIHFDMEGKIGSIVGHPTLYKRDQVIVIHSG